MAGIDSRVGSWARSARVAFAVLTVLVVASLAAGPARAGLWGVSPPLSPGNAAVLLAPGGHPPYYWLPERGVHLSIEVFARVARFQRREFHSGQLKVFIHHQLPSLPCKRSAAADGGVAVRAMRAYPFPGGRGRIDVSESGVTLLEKSTNVRVCVWLARHAREQVDPTSQLIPVLTDRDFAAAIVGEGSFVSDRPNYSVNAESPGAFTVAGTEMFCGTQQAIPGTTVYFQDGLWHFSQASSGSGGDSPACQQNSSTYTFGTFAGNGSFTYHWADSLDGAGLPQTLGGCEFNAMYDDLVSEARAYVNSVGCRVGRVLPAQFQRQYPPGVVLGAFIDAGKAQLARRGTTVDLVTNGPARGA